MKRRLLAMGAAALLALSLAACADTAEPDALRAENAALAAENQALQAENQRLTEAQAALEEQVSRLEQAAADTDGNGYVSWEDSNPIDDFFDEGMYWDCGTTICMRIVAGTYAEAWETELRHLAETQKAELLCQEDKDLIDAFVQAVEDQADVFCFDPEAAGRELDEQLGEDILQVREAAEAGQ